MSKKDKPPFLPSPQYEVGYGKTPEGTRFRKGQSGNPKGRPLGSVNRIFAAGEDRLFDAVRKEAARAIKVREGGEEIEIPMIQAFVRTAMAKAVQGSARHGELIMKLAANSEGYDRRQHERLIEAAINYKTYWEEELEQRRRLGIVHLSNPVPHPDQIRIDTDTDEVVYIGPMSRQEKAELEAFLAEQHKLVDAFEAEREALIADAEANHADDQLIGPLIEPFKLKYLKDVAMARKSLDAFASICYLDRT